jgi:DNA-binding transcriptional ArsR family regulator
MSNNRPVNIEELADVFKALSNVNRLKIIRKLMNCCDIGTKLQLDDDKKTAYIGELGVDLGIGKSTISHHIKELRRVKLIITERHGQKIKCWINPELVKSIGGFFR